MFDQASAEWGCRARQKLQTKIGGWKIFFGGGGETTGKETIMNLTEFYNDFCNVYMSL